MRYDFSFDFQTYLSCSESMHQKSDNDSPPLTCCSIIHHTSDLRLPSSLNPSTFYRASRPSTSASGTSTGTTSIQRRPQISSCSMIYSPGFGPGGRRSWMSLSPLMGGWILPFIWPILSQTCLCPRRCARIVMLRTLLQSYDHIA
jgi:hypothetical protein